ncbi:uncharacterized protein RNJ42_02439 [Nakaseomyces bracarensis]|uniref:uncharacterized protein n=1 Tax=Nakaseomyces bracarensis TaxID=273131 RepID=UPI003871186D
MLKGSSIESLIKTTTTLNFIAKEPVIYPKARQISITTYNKLNFLRDIETNKYCQRQEKIASKMESQNLAALIDEMTSELQDVRKVVVSRVNQRDRLVSDMMERYRSNLRILQEQRVTVLSELERYQNEEEKMKETLQQLNSTKDEFKSEIESYQIRAEKLSLEREELQRQLADLNKIFDEKAKEISKYKEMILRQRQLDNPEIKLYEKLLGLQIDKADVNTIKFTFTDGGREKIYKAVIVDVSQLNEPDKPLKIKQIESTVTQQQTDDLEKTLNEQGIIPFLIQAKQALT